MHNLIKIIAELDKAIDQADCPAWGDQLDALDNYYEAMETIRALRDALKDSDND